MSTIDVVGELALALDHLKDVESKLYQRGLDAALPKARRLYRSASLALSRLRKRAEGGAK